MLDVKQLRLLVCLMVLGENPDAKQKDLFPKGQPTLFERKFDALGITPEYPLSIRHVPEFYNNLAILNKYELTGKYKVTSKGKEVIELLDADWRKWHSLETYLDLLTIPF